MICAWDALLRILPQWLRNQVENQENGGLQEIRLRSNAPPELVLPEKSRWLERDIRREDIQFCVNAASRYSPWASDSLAQGFITAEGGHRIGICGSAVCQNGLVTGIREIDSICIRIARDFPGAANKIREWENILILGAPGWGKTTLLRDLIRTRAMTKTIAVSDERGELFPNGFRRGQRMDVLTGVPKAEAIERLIRTMGPSLVAVDEITAEEDCMALYRASCCGVGLMATAHGASLEDFFSRAVYKPLQENQLFDTVVVLRPDRSYRIERLRK